MAFKTFLESILVYHLPQYISQYNHVIKSANKLSKKQLADVGNILEILSTVPQNEMPAYDMY